MGSTSMQDSSGREAACDRRILLIDDHPLFRAGLKTTLIESGFGWRVAEAANLVNALELLSRAAPFDLILYDWHLPGGGGCRGLVALCELAPQIPVLVITADEGEAIRFAAKDIGASDCLSKSEDAARVCAVVARILRMEPVGATAPAGAVASRPAPPASLTPRQRAVLQLMAGGDSNKNIASRLGIADTTVRAHVSGILRSLAARNRTEAVVKAVSEGQLAPPLASGPFAARSG